MTTHGHGQIVITCAHLTLTCRKLSRSRLFVLVIMSVIQLRPHTCGLVRIELRSCSCHKRNRSGVDLGLHIRVQLLCSHWPQQKALGGGIWCIDMVMMTLTLKMCCTETGDAAITSSFHKLTAAQSPHTQKLSDGHVSPWNVFFYCTCHESVDVDKDTWIAQCKNKQMFEAVNKTPA